MIKHHRSLARMLVITTCMVAPAPLLAGAYGESAVRDGAVANTARAQNTVPCPRLNRNIPASLAAEMDCGSAAATPRVAGERVRNTGGLFGGHDVGSAPPANSDDDGPRTKVVSPDDGNDEPPSNDDGPTDGDDNTNDDGDGPNDGGNFTSKLDRLEELGVSVDAFGGQSEEFRESFDSYLEENGPGGDWSGFNP